MSAASSSAASVINRLAEAFSSQDRRRPSADNTTDSPRDDDKKDDDDSRKKKRIQQACRSCGIKRVKCDGLKPCTTCLKSGEMCEYGQPKKRGPPKGSTRGGSKAAARRAAQLEAQNSSRTSTRQQAEALEAQATTPWHFAPQQPQPQTASNASTETSTDPHYAQSTGNARDGPGPLLYRPQSHPPPVDRDFRPSPSLHPQPPVLRYSQDYHERDTRGRLLEGMTDGFVTDRNSLGTSSVGGDSAPSPQSNDASATGAMAAAAEARRPPNTIYHGTTSGLGILRAQNGDRKLPSLFFSSSLSFASIGNRGDGDSRVDYAREMKRPLRSPHWDTSSGRAFQGRRFSGSGSPPPSMPRLPRSTASGEPKRPNSMLPLSQETSAPPSSKDAADIRLRLHLDRGQGNLSKATGADSGPAVEVDLEPLLWETPEDVLRFPKRGGITLTKPVIPQAVVERVFTIVWGILQTSWPLLYKPALPLLGQYDVIDEEKRPLLYNVVAALSSRGWFNGNVSDSEARSDTAKSQSDWDESKFGLGSGHSLTYLDGTVRPVTTVELSSIFHVRAKYYLISSYTEPSLEAVQSLLIMALREQGIGHPTQAAHYQSNACRMVYDLGLHRHCDFSTTLGISLSHAEEQERRRALWVCYVLDKANTCSLDKPSNMRDHEVDCPLPDRNEPDENEIWAEVAGATSLIRDEARPMLLKTPTRAMSHLLAVIELAQITECILVLYNSVREKLPPKERDESWETKLLSLHLRLEDLQNSLGSDLRIEDPRNCLPNRLCLAIWLAVSKLILHRPHILKVPTREGMPSSHQVCWQEVGRICQIVESYSKNFGLRKLSQTFVYAIFTSCTIELANTTSMDVAIAQEAKRRLKLLMGALSPISGTWYSASQHLEILKRLARGIDADVDGTGIDLHPLNPTGQLAAANRISSTNVGGDGDSAGDNVGSAAEAAGGTGEGRPTTSGKLTGNGAGTLNLTTMTSDGVAAPHQGTGAHVQLQQVRQQQQQQQTPLDRRPRSALGGAMHQFDHIPGPLGAPMDFSHSRNSLLGPGLVPCDEMPTFDGNGGNGNHATAAAGILASDASSLGNNAANAALGMVQDAMPAIQGPAQGQAAMAPPNASYGWAPSLDSSAFDMLRGAPSGAMAAGGGGNGDLMTTAQGASPMLQAPGLVSGGVSQNGGGVYNGLSAAGGYAGTNPALDTDALLRFHDASYWGLMPLNPDDPLSWANFTNSYVEALATVLGPHGATSNDASQQPQQP